MMFFASVLGVIVASVFIVFIFISALIGLVAAAATQEAAPLSLSPRTVVKIDLSELKEVPEENPLDQLMGKTRSIAFVDVLRNIRKAKENENISGIYLNMSGLSGGTASMSELRAALLDFKKSKKFIYAYGDLMSQGSYYIASVADRIFLNPEGGIELRGVGVSTMFYKGLLDKLGAQMMIFKVGKYKSAVEPFSREDFSEPNREQMKVFTDGIWSNLKQAIATSRHLKPEAIQSFADSGKFTDGAQVALEAGLVDTLAYELDMDALLAKKVDVDVDDLSYISLADLNAVSLSSDAKFNDESNKVKVLFAEGEIVYGNGDTPAYDAKTNINQSLCNTIKDAAEDDDVKALVIRVNSPGGSAFTANQIWHQLKEFAKTGKPYVVSMGDYAASGGYYISAPANYIYAEPMTLTGSIGIFGMFPNVSGLAKKLGVTTDGVSTAKYAQLGNIYEPMGQDEYNLIQRNVERGYRTFLGVVADGRKMTTAAVDSIAQGRVWLGQDAVKIGLVDGLGNLDMAIRKAAELAKLGSYSIDYEVTATNPIKSLLENYLSMQAVKGGIMDMMLTKDEQELLNQSRLMRERTGIMARLPYGFKIY